MNSAGFARWCIGKAGRTRKLKVARLSVRDSGRPTAVDTVEIIRGLARQLPDRFITQVLNRLKMPTAKGHTWNEARVRAIRHGYDIAVYQEGEREGRGELNMLEAARELKVDRGRHSSVNRGWTFARFAGLSVTPPG